MLKEATMVGDGASVTWRSAAIHTHTVRKGGKPHNNIQNNGYHGNTPAHVQYNTHQRERATKKS